MARDISTVVPDYIAELVYKRWGDMKSFSVSVGLPYTAVYSVLVKSTQRPLVMLEALAKPLHISMEEMADILLIPDLALRKQKLEELLAGKSQNQWAREAGLHGGTVGDVVNNLEQTQLRNVVTISRALNIDLKSFLRQFSHRNIAS